MGTKVQSVRVGRSHNNPQSTAKLNEIGFVWDPNTKNAQTFLQAVKSFKLLHGHLKIPRNYEVPHGEIGFEKEAYGLKLGMKVHNVIYRGDYGPELRQQFEELGLKTSLSGVDTRHWDYIYTALQVYKSVYGHLKVCAY